MAAEKNLAHLPIVVDPSHATGRVDLIKPMTLSAILAASCDGFMIEVHPSPKDALSDSDPQLAAEQFESLIINVCSALAYRDKIWSKRVNGGV